MKGKWIIAALLCAALLGCSRSQTFPSPGSLPRLSPTKQTENDNLRCYPLSGANCRFFVFGESLLIYDQQEQTLRCFRGRNLLCAASAEVTGALCKSDDSLFIYDQEEEKLTRLNDDLSPGATFSLPGCREAPMITGGEIYYTTGTGLVAMEMDSGIRRLVRQQPGLHITALIPAEGLAACTRDDGGAFFLNLADGTAVSDTPEILAACCSGEKVQLCMRLGNYHCLYLGEKMLPLSAGWEFLEFLPENNGALLYQPEGKLGIYDLTTGNCMAKLTLPEEGKPEEVGVLADGRVFFRYGSLLYGWQPVTDPQRSNQVTITPLVTSQSPNAAHLTQCRQRSAYLENQYGVKVLLSDDATKLLPPGVTAEPEFLREYILDVLTGMESALSRFPSELVKSAFSGGGRTYLCPVREISVDGAKRNYLQFWEGQDCYILLAGSTETEKDMIYAFFPLIWRKILMKSDALDSWPEEFDGTELLYRALQPNQRSLFLDAGMQNRLRELSAGIRTAFGLPSSESYLWEQYLWKR